VVAQFLGLKLQLLANLFRRSPWQIVGVALGLLYGLLVAAALVAMLVAFRGVDDIRVIRDGIIVGGSIVVLGFFLVPLVFGVDDSMDPRKFNTMGIPNKQLAFGLAVSSLVGVPATTLALVLVGTIITWSRGPGETLLAVIAAALLLVTCMLASRVSTSLAASMLSTRRARDFTGILGVLLVVIITPVVVLLFNVEWSRYGLDLLGGFAAILGWTPLGAAWAIPGNAASGDWGVSLLRLLIAVATAYLLWLAWQGLVARMLVTPGRAAQARAYGGLGWFDRLPHNATGAIAARSITYWGRDPRYWVSLVMIPIVPVLVILPLVIAGVPIEYLSLVPVPLMCVFLGWTLHNDVAYDHTAIWLHVVSGPRGVADRMGRLVPALFVGIPLIGLGSAASVAVYGDWAVLPGLLGVSTCILLAGLGLSSYTSARFPYPATKPGDSPFAQPQASDTAAAVIQSFTFVGSVIVATPAIICLVLGIFADPIWNLPALYWGLGLGAFTFVGGVWAGSRTFERRGPEMLSSALRA
jgi:ABC-2 type transport system permease protein